MNTADIFRAAADVVDRDDGWTRHWFALREPVTDPHVASYSIAPMLSPGNPQATCFCAAGAVHMVEGSNPMDETEASAFLVACVKRDYGVTVAQWNDSIAKDGREVAEALRRYADEWAAAA